MIYEMGKAKYTREDIVVLLRRWYDATGHVPCAVVWGRRSHAPQDLVALHKAGGYPTMQTVANRCGSWRDALEAAGFDVVRPWDRERIVDAMHAWERAYGRAPRAMEWRRQGDEIDIGMDRPSLQTVIDHFGTWRAGLRAANMYDSSYRGHWDRLSIIEAIRAWHARHGHVPSLRDWAWASKTTPTAQTVLAHFGTWRKAIIAAGFAPRRVGQHVCNDEQRAE